VLLRRFEPRDERARFVRVILEEVARLDRIVTSLLQYARPRLPVLKPGSLEACIERVRELQDEALARARVRVEVDVAPRLPTVYFDGDLITQVLLNVTLNALQAMPRGGTLRFEVRGLRRRHAPRAPGRRATDPAGERRPAPPGWLAYLQVRDSARHARQAVRSVLLDQTAGHRPRPCHLTDHHARARRQHRDREPRASGHHRPAQLPRGETSWPEAKARPALTPPTPC